MTLGGAAHVAAAHCLNERIKSCDQVSALTTFTENGFQKGLKTGAVFLDLTAAYDTVWRTSLLVKISKVLSGWAVDMVALFLQNCRFI